MKRIRGCRSNLAAIAVVLIWLTFGWSGGAIVAEEGTWNGFRRLELEVGGRPVTVVVPRQPAKGLPWVWHGEFFGHRAIPDVALLGRGFHVVFARFSDQFGGPAAVQHWNAVYAAVRERYGLGPRPALVGTSRGGLYVYNWAAANPERVCCIFGDAPVCDLKSWPMGRGSGRRSDGEVQKLLQVYGLTTEEELLSKASIRSIVWSHWRRQVFRFCMSAGMPTRLCL